MAYQETNDLGCDRTFALGGVRTDKKTNKKYKNPKEVEGFFLGTKKGIDTGNDKPSNLHIFEGTVKNDKGETIFTGKVGIWGKTDLDRKAAQWKLDLMTKAFFDKMQDPSDVKRGRQAMYLYKAFQDPDNVNPNGTAVAGGEEVYEDDSPAAAEEEVAETEGEEAYEEEAALDAEETLVDEPAAKPATKAAKVATPAADRQAAMQKLVGNKPAAKSA